eukprot:TRINITY_DN3002_c0_g1_i1.p1 TRINITY_DN3002_c0_g1~~TRINITY_DN3002_c0_g1_i1.p1  ORF type:complete len:102 (+),score=18.95 TRINITY_DN3002_c0_g1_i1:47-307(+)
MGGFFSDLEWYYYAAAGAVFALLIASVFVVMHKRRARDKELVTWSDIAALDCPSAAPSPAHAMVTVVGHNGQQSIPPPLPIVEDTI